MSAHQELATREAAGEDISDQIVQPAAEAEDADEAEEESEDGAIEEGQEVVLAVEDGSADEEDGPAAA